MAKKKRTAKGVSKRRAKKTGVRGAAVDGVSTETLKRELKRRQAEFGRLVSRRDRVAAQLAELEAELMELGGAGGYGATARGGVRRRPRNETNLADALVKVLTGSTMGVTEVAEAVQAAGYRTSAANFRTIVNQTLLRDKRIKKVSRGRYTAK